MYLVKFRTWLLDELKPEEGKGLIQKNNLSPNYGPVGLLSFDSLSLL